MEKGILFFMAAAMKSASMVEDMKDACYNYEENPSDENFETIYQLAHLIIAKKMVGDDIGKAMEVIKDFDLYQEREKLFQVDKN
jgi:hypothetical protein